MSILVDRNTKVLVATSDLELTRAMQSKDYGTNIVGAVSHGSGGLSVNSIPFFNTISEGIQKTKANALLIEVKKSLVADTIMEGIESGVDIIVCTTEGIPVKDMMYIKKLLRDGTTKLIGPSSIGIITPGECSIGPLGQFFMPGSVGILSRYSSLLYESAYCLTSQEIGQSTCVDIGLDMLIGLDLHNYLQLFANDNKTKAILIIERSSIIDNQDAINTMRNIAIPIVVVVPGLSIMESSQIEEFNQSEVLINAGVKLAKNIVEARQIISEVLKI